VTFRVNFLSTLFQTPLEGVDVPATSAENFGASFPERVMGPVVASAPVSPVMVISSLTALANPLSVTVSVLAAPATGVLWPIALVVNASTLELHPNNTRTNKTPFQRKEHGIPGRLDCIAGRSSEATRIAKSARAGDSGKRV